MISVVSLIKHKQKGQLDVADPLRKNDSNMALELCLWLVLAASGKIFKASCIADIDPERK